eukprot:5126760-Ditylum_brightwellii.AAC.1
MSSWEVIFSACQRGDVCSGLKENHCVFRDGMERDSLKIQNEVTSVESIQKGIDLLLKVASACFLQLIHVGMLWVDAAGLSFEKMDVTMLEDPESASKDEKSRLCGVALRAAEMYEDVLFQRSISQMMFCDDSTKNDSTKDFNYEEMGELE